MTVPKITIARIRNNRLRRVAMLAVWPGVLARVFWPVLLLPVMFVLLALAGAWDAVVDFGGWVGRKLLYDWRLLRAAWALMWAEPLGDVEPRIMPKRVPG
jgi:hypothetical protein